MINRLSLNNSINIQLVADFSASLTQSLHCQLHFFSPLGSASLVVEGQDAKLPSCPASDELIEVFVSIRKRRPRTIQLSRFSAIHSHSRSLSCVTTDLVGFHEHQRNPNFELFFLRPGLMNHKRKTSFFGCKTNESTYGYAGYIRGAGYRL